MFRSALVAASLLAPMAAFAQQESLLQEGITLYENLEYEASIERLSAALLRPGNSPQDRIEINRYLGLNYLTLGREEPAEGAFRNLLVQNPDYQFDPNTTAPEIIQFFDGVRQRWDAEGRPGLERATQVAASVRINHISPAEAERGTEIVLTGTVTDPERVSTNLVLAYRSGSTGTFSRIPGTGGPEGFRAVVPADAVEPPVVEYYLEAVDASGLPLAARGDSDAPLRVQVPDPDAGGGVLSSWWFWAGAGAVVLGGAALGFVLLGGDGGGTGPTNEQATIVIVLQE